MRKSDAVYSILLGLFSGAMVGVVSGLTHRAFQFGLPVGLIGVVLMLIAFVVFNRTIGGRLGLLFGLLALLGVLAAFYFATDDAIILDDLFGMILAGAVVMSGTIALAWPESSTSRFDDEGPESPEPRLESPRQGV